MLKRPILAAFLLLAAAAHAVILPLKINLQGKLVDPATNAPRNGSFSVIFKLYDAASGGSALYTEAQTLSVDNGVFSTTLGSNALLGPDLFSGASAYLGIAVSPDTEMTPRQQLVMSPYAFTSAQLVSDGDIRVNSGTAYSTFTTAGNWLVPAGVVAGTATFTGALTASSGTFTASGTSQYSLQASSGISVLAGTLKLAAASGGLDATGAGVTADTGRLLATGPAQFSLTTSSGIIVQAGTFRMQGGNGIQADFGVTAATVVATGFVQNKGAAAPPVSPAGSGRLYFDSALGQYQVSENAGAYVQLVAPAGTQNMWDTNATAAVANQGTNLAAALTELDTAVLGARISINCDDIGGQVALRYNMRSLQTTALTIVISLRDTSNTANVLATASIAANAVTTYVADTVYAAKPAWCSGNKIVGVYTSGGNGTADYIFSRIGLLWKP